MFFNGPTNPMPPYASSQFPAQMMGHGSRMAPMTSAAPKGGLLSRLFGKGTGTKAAGHLMQGSGAPNIAGHMMHGFGSSFPGAMTAANTGSAAATATGGGSILNWINQAQRVIGIAQQVGPMVQQYGPIIRSAPALYRMYRDSKKTNDSTEASVKELVADPSLSSELEISDQEVSETPLKKAQAAPKQTVAGMPAPKLYV